MHGGPHGLSQAELEAKEKAQAEGTWGKSGTAARDRDRRRKGPVEPGDAPTIMNGIANSFVAGF